jgi:hypothetical protein
VIDRPRRVRAQSLLTGTATRSAAPTLDVAGFSLVVELGRWLVEERALFTKII